MCGDLVLTCGTMPCTSCFSPAPHPSTMSTVCVCARAFPVYTMLGSVPTMQVPARVSPCQPSPESWVFCALATAALSAPLPCGCSKHACISPQAWKGQNYRGFLPGARLLGWTAGPAHALGAAFGCGGCKKMYFAVGTVPPYASISSTSASRR